jgi:hypothetical protein
MSTPANVSLEDSHTVAALFAELHALREDVKLLLGNHAKSPKFLRASALSNDADASISEIKTCNRGMDSMPSAAEEVLRDLKVEVNSLRTTMQADLHTIKESFLAKLEALTPLRSQESDPPPDIHPNMKEVAIAMQHQHQSKV